MAPPPKGPSSKGPAAPKGPARPGASGTRPAAGSAGRGAAAKAATLSTSASSSFKVKNVKTGDYKADLGTRVGAALIDLVVGWIPGLIFVLQGLPVVAVFFPILYLLAKDGLPIPALEFRSVGKRIVGLHVESTATGESKLDIGTSAKRNLPLVAGLILFIFLDLAGLPSIVGLVVAAVPPLVELVMLSKDPNGLRMGDKLAGTKVLD